MFSPSSLPSKQNIHHEMKKFGLALHLLKHNGYSLFQPFIVKYFKFIRNPYPKEVEVIFKPENKVVF